jgi:hypothetical protein
MLPTVAITESCLAQVEEELDRVNPREGLAVPLLWIKKRAPEPNPATLLRLAQIEQVIIARALLVPPEKQLNGCVRVGVLAETDRLLAEATRALTRRHPRLRACAYLHSHPFARGGTRPSRGATCDYEGHMIPLLERNRDAGLAASFSFIACRTWKDDGWELHCFALDEHEDIGDLGLARRIPDSHPDAVAALLPPLSRRPIHRLVRGWLSRLRRARVHYRVDELFDGWLRIILDASAQTSLVVLLPISFPRQPAQLFVWNREANEVTRCDGEPCALGHSGALLSLAKAIEEVDHGTASRLLLESAPADR